MLEHRPDPSPRFHLLHKVTNQSQIWFSLRILIHQEERRGSNSSAGDGRGANWRGLGASGSGWLGRWVVSRTYSQVERARRQVEAGRKNSRRFEETRARGPVGLRESLQSAGRWSQSSRGRWSSARGRACGLHGAPFPEVSVCMMFIAVVIEYRVTTMDYRCGDR